MATHVGRDVGPTGSPHRPTPPESARTESPRRPALRLLQAAVSPSLSTPRTLISNAAARLHVVKGVRSKFCFGAGFSGPGGLAESRQLPPTPGLSASALWSPPGPSDAPSAERRRPIEHRIRGLFCRSEPEQKESVSAAADAAKSKEEAPPSPFPVCCICLDDMTEGKQHHLRCPQCTMQAHSRCLARWFQSEQTCLAGRGAPLNGPFLRSSATCPSCRGELDWDALALQARRSKHQDPMPINFALARGNDDFRHKSVESAHPGEDTFIRSNIQRHGMPRRRNNGRQPVRSPQDDLDEFTSFNDLIASSS